MTELSGEWGVWLCSRRFGSVLPGRALQPDSFIWRHLMLIVLIGPKGCGKSYIGSLAERELGIPFFRVEPVFMNIRRDRSPDDPEYIREGFAEAEEQIRHMLAEKRTVLIESTGAADEFWSMLDRLAEAVHTVLVRITAPFDLCMERIHSRDQALQIPVSEEMILRMYRISTGISRTFQAEIDNSRSTDEAILNTLRKVMRMDA